MTRTTTTTHCNATMTRKPMKNKMNINNNHHTISRRTNLTTRTYFHTSMTRTTTTTHCNATMTRKPMKNKKNIKQQSSYNK